MAALVLNTLKSQLPLLVEKYEPEIEAKLRESLRTIKASHPEEVSIFLTNWTKLNNAVQQELSASVTPPAMGGRKRKTRKHKKRT
jgi:hypothetical protein